MGISYKQNQHNLHNHNVYAKLNDKLILLIFKELCR